MSVSAEQARLSVELLRLALHEVDRCYRELNHSLFGGALQRPVFEWTETTRELGAWEKETRRLRLSESLVDGAWGVLIEILKHEMAHQFVDEVLGIEEDSPHGASFQQVCRERGIDGRAAGLPVAPADSTPALDTAVLSRISGLLSLAQSDNQHEAEAAMAAARRLMLKYNLDHVAAPRAYSFRHVGRPTGRRAPWQRILANILDEFFFVDVIIVPVYRPREGKRGSVLELLGSPENLEIASYVHDFLEHAGEELWRSHKKKAGLRGDRDRASFLFGVMSGFRDKLRREAEKARGEGLVWVGDPELSRYARARHPYVRRVGSSGQVEPGAFAAGREAGNRLVLHRGVTSGASGASPRLLGRGSNK